MFIHSQEYFNSAASQVPVFTNNWLQLLQLQEIFSTLMYNNPLSHMFVPALCIILNKQMQHAIYIIKPKIIIPTVEQQHLHHSQ